MLTSLKDNTKASIESGQVTPLQESLLSPEEKFRDEIRSNSVWSIIQQVISINIRKVPSNLIDSDSSTTSSRTMNDKTEVINTIKRFWNF